jgi:hypothetical protein
MVRFCKKHGLEVPGLTYNFYHYAIDDDGNITDAFVKKYNVKP